METKLVPQQRYFVVETKTTLSKIQTIAPKEAEKLMQEIHALKLEMTGPMEFIYFDCTNDVEKEFSLEIAVPIKENGTKASTGYVIKQHAPFKCISYVHHGDLKEMNLIYEKLFTELWNKSIKQSNQIREVYLKYDGQLSKENITEFQIGIL